MDAELILVSLVGGLAVIVLLADWLWDRRASEHLPTKEDSHGTGAAGML